MNNNLRLAAFSMLLGSIPAASSVPLKAQDIELEYDQIFVDLGQSMFNVAKEKNLDLPRKFLIPTTRQLPRFLRDYCHEVIYLQSGTNKYAYSKSKNKDISKDTSLSREILDTAWPVVEEERLLACLRVLFAGKPYNFTCFPINATSF